MFWAHEKLPPFSRPLPDMSWQRRPVASPLRPLAQQLQHQRCRRPHLPARSLDVLRQPAPFWATSPFEGEPPQGEPSWKNQHSANKFSRRSVKGHSPHAISPRLSTYPVDFEVKEARSEPCSVCGRLIDPSQPFSEFRSPIHPNMRFFFHPACEQLWRDEASRFGSPHHDPPAS